MKHFLTLRDFSKEEILSLVNHAIELKKEPKKLLQDKTLAMIFEKNSTRTRMAFELAITELGGKALFLSSNDLQLSRGEPVKDTARVIGAMVDFVMMRVNKHETLLEFARYSKAPVINALSDNKPHAIAEVITAATTADASHSIAEYFEAIRILVLTNVINVAVPEESITDEIKQQCQALNISMVANCEFDQIPVLASPVVQGGIYVSQVDKLILKADILDIPEDQVQSYIVGELFAHKYVVREGHLVRSLAQDTGDANTNTDQEVKELTEYVANIQGKFVDCVLPVLRALLVI